MSHPLGFSNLWALHSALTALEKKSQGRKASKQCTLGPSKAAAVGLVATSDSCGCNFGVVCQTVSETTCVY